MQFARHSNDASTPCQEGVGRCELRLLHHNDQVGVWRTPTPPETWPRTSRSRPSTTSRGSSSVFAGPARSRTAQAGRASGLDRFQHVGQLPRCPRVHARAFSWHPRCLPSAAGTQTSGPSRTDLKMAILLQPCGFGGSAQRTQLSAERRHGLITHDVRPGFRGCRRAKGLGSRDGRIGRSRRLTRGRLRSGDHRRVARGGDRVGLAEKIGHLLVGLHDVRSGRLSGRRSLMTSRYENDRQNQRPSHRSSSRA